MVELTSQAKQPVGETRRFLRPTGSWSLMTSVGGEVWALRQKLMDVYPKMDGDEGVISPVAALQAVIV